MARSAPGVGYFLGSHLTGVPAAVPDALVEEIRAYSQDGHPTVNGTYLAACVLYGTIFGRSPVGNPYSDRSLSAETRAYLQRIAAEGLGTRGAD